MALLDSKIYKIQSPDSESNIAFEEYEFMLGWYNREGSPVQWLFEDWENRQRVRSTPNNLKDSLRIGSLVSNEDLTKTFTAEDLTRDQKNLFESLLVAETVYRIFRTDSELYEAGGFQKVAILSGEIRFIQSKQRFTLTIQIQLPEPAQWR